jgi:decaprenyl-phosphate phosphoribosyltransferase
MRSSDGDARSWSPPRTRGQPVAAVAFAGTVSSTLESDVPGVVAGGHERHVSAGAETPRRGVVRATLVTIRPRQWIKNLLVVAAPGAAGALARDDVPLRVTFAFVAFCLLASGIYAVNDVRDAPEDRLHPRKRYRPVAAGELAPRVALGVGATLMIAGLVCCALVRPALALVGAGYLALTLTYSTVWRRIAFVDLTVIAGGFVLRAVAGGVAAPVTLSRWFLLVVTFGAVFVAAGKRHAELQGAGGARAGGRRVLRHYTEARLRVVFMLSLALALTAYLGWAVLGGEPLRAITIAPFAGCLVRYSLLLRRGAGEAPEELVLHDRWLRLFGLLWIITFVITVHATR